MGTNDIVFVFTLLWTAPLLCKANRAVCPADWSASGRYCYCSSDVAGANATANFMDAKFHCQRLGAELLEVDAENTIEIESILDIFDSRFVFWIDTKLNLMEENQVNFDQNSSSISSSMACSYLVKKDGRLQYHRHGSCFEEHRYICKRPTLNGKKTRVRRDIDSNIWSSPLNHPSLTVHPNSNVLSHKRNRIITGNNYPKLRYPFRDIYNSNSIPTIYHPPLLRHQILIPHHQGGTIHPLDSLFRIIGRVTETSTSDAPPKTTKSSYTQRVTETMTNNSREMRDNNSTDNFSQTRMVEHSSLRNSTPAIDNINTTDASSLVQTTITTSRMSENRTVSSTTLTSIPERKQVLSTYEVSSVKGNTNINSVAVERYPGCMISDVKFRRSCYATIKRPLSYKESSFWCYMIRHGSSTVYINNRDENAFLVNHFNKLGAYIWISFHMRSKGENALLDEVQESSNVTFTNWANNEPAYSVGDCVYASGATGRNGEWFVDNCDAQHHVLCEYPSDEIELTTQIPITRQACSSGWAHYPITDACYKLFTHGGQRRSIAELNCIQYGGHLVSIGQDDERSFISLVLRNTHFEYTSFWTGLTYSNFRDNSTNFTWLDGTPANIQHWARGQPPYRVGQQRCVVAHKTNLELVTTDCDGYFAYMCKIPAGMVHGELNPITEAPASQCQIAGKDDWANYGDYCYKVYSSRNVNPLSWRSARQFCIDQGSDLLSLESQDENSFIISQVYKENDSWMWTGGSNDIRTGYQWSDKSPFVYINWKLGEPNDYMDQESCIVIQPKGQVMWNDANCGTKFGWICKARVAETGVPSSSSVNTIGNCPEGWTNTGRSCIKFKKEPAEFHVARSFCKSFQEGELASIHNRREEAIMSTLLNDYRWSVFIGMVYTHHFVWLDESPVDYTSWMTGEPNNNGNSRSESDPVIYFRHSTRETHEECVELYAAVFGAKWNDVSCASQNAYFCQRPLDPNILTATPVEYCSPPYNTYKKYSGACYKMITTPASWQKAHQYCLAEGADLVSIETGSECDYVGLETHDAGVNGSWTGLSTIKRADQFEWSVKYPVLYTNWDNNEPVVSNSSSRCALISANNIGHWVTDDCNEEKSFICKYNEDLTKPIELQHNGICPNDEWVDFPGEYCYLFYKQPFTWSAANEKCQNESSHLVSIHSDHEMEIVIRITMTHLESIWSGLSRSIEGFVWSDDSPYDFLHWASHEPNNEVEKCVEMLMVKREWNDNRCGILRPFLCKILKEFDVNEASNFRQDLSLSTGGTAGIVVCAVVLLAAAACIAYSYRNKLMIYKQTPRTSQATCFDNALYDPNMQDTFCTSGLTLTDSPLPPTECSSTQALIESS